MMPKQVASPSPVPCPTGLVVKNGSKIRSWVAASMPEPVSVTRTYALTSSRSTERRSVPPPGMASRALLTRFSTTWSNRTESIITTAGLALGSMLRLMCSPTVRVRSGLKLSSRWLRSVGFGADGFCRENSSSCRVNAAARSAASSTQRMSARRGSSSSRALRTNPANPMISDRMLLKSWAMPPASRPTLCIFWCCRNSADRCSRSVTSSTVPCHSTASPCSSVTV